MPFRLRPALNSSGNQPAPPSSAMNFSIYISLLAAVMLTALPLCASAAPLVDAHADSPSGEASGDGEETSYLPGACMPVLKTLEQMIAPTNLHKKEFEEEFKGNVRYSLLENYKHSSFPTECPSNYTKEACLGRLVQGLQTYTVLLKHVQREYSNSSILSEVQSKIPHLISLIENEMKNSKQVKEMSSSKEEKLLKELHDQDTYHRKMTAHSILFYLRSFLIDSKRSFRTWEKPRC